MLETELKLEYAVNENENDGMPVIIVAAGMSSRMGGIDKQAALLQGIPVLARTLMHFESSPIISAIILVVKAEDIFSIQLMTQKYGITKLTDIVCGGATRQESVLSGLNRLSKSDEFVLIHDGARPLTEEFIIKNVADALKNYSAVTCAVPLKDTVKQIDENDEVVATPNRSSLVAVQTPQGVRVNDYKAAIEKVKDVSEFTDDMSIMEAAGFKVLTVEGSYKNIKITTPEDIKAAEALLLEEDSL